jgi:hypothetical protein
MKLAVIFSFLFLVTVETVCGGTRIGAFNFVYNDTSRQPSTWINPFATDGESLPVEGSEEEGNLSKVRVIRDFIEWKDFEPFPGYYLNGTLHRPLSGKLWPILHQLDANPNLKLALTVRTHAGLDPFWAFSDYLPLSASHVPYDLTEDFHHEFAYSEIYYSFIRSLVETFKNFRNGAYHDRLCAVFIENEMNTEGHFYAGTDDASQAVHAYARMAATAKKAVKDVDNLILVFDGGFQGFSSIWVLLDKYITDDSDYQKAAEFYNLSFPFDDYDVCEIDGACDPTDFRTFSRDGFKGDMTKLTYRVKTKVSAYAKQWIIEALSNSMLWRENPGAPIVEGLPLDGMNIHNYQEYRAFLIMLNDLYLPYCAPDTLLVSNEFGAKPSQLIVDRDRNMLARREMIMKLAIAKYRLDEMVLWYTLSEKRLIDEMSKLGHIGGLLEYITSTHGNFEPLDHDDSDDLKDDTVRAFKRMIDLVGGKEDEKYDETNANFSRYRFVYHWPHFREVTIVWRHHAGARYYDPGECNPGQSQTIYNHAGKALNRDPPFLLYKDQPIIFVCEETPPDG